MNFYDFETKDIDGNGISLNEYRGKPALIVNTASQCGFTPQYAGLQELHEHYGEKFHVLGFPCNQFGAQEPGTESEIKQFCETSYGVTFPMFSKLDVKGDHQSEIYHYLVSETGEEPKWNFHKYIVDKEGNVVKSVGTKTPPTDEDLVNTLLDLS